LEHLYECLRRLALVTPQRETAGPDLFSSVLELENTKPSKPIFDDDYAIVLTPAPPGSIPARVWRTSHVIYL
jgi:hypothetical protein